MNAKHIYKKIWIFYCADTYNVNSGGNSVFYKVCKYFEELGYNNFYICPRVCDGNGIITSIQDGHKDKDRWNRGIFSIDDLNDDFFDKNKYNIPNIYI